MDARTQKTINFDWHDRQELIRCAQLPTVKVTDGEKQVGVSPLVMTSTLHAIHNRLGKNAECWPSVKTLANDANCNERTVRRAIRALQELSLLIVDRRSRGGRNRVNHYRIVWSELALMEAKYRADIPDRSSGHEPISSGTGVRHQAVLSTAELKRELESNTASPLSPQRHSGVFTLVKRSPRGRGCFENSDNEGTNATMSNQSLFASMETGVLERARHPVDEPAPPKPEPKPTQNDSPQKPPVKTVKQRIYDAKRRAVKLGIQGPGCVTTALRDGADISAIEAVLAYYEANPGAWGPGALHRRIMHAASMDDPADGWPARNVLKPAKPAAPVQKDPVLRWAAIRADLVRQGRRKDAPEDLIRQVLERRLEQFVASYPESDRKRVSTAIENAGGAY